MIRPILDRKNIEINPLLETYGKYIQQIDQALENELDIYSESEFIEPLKYSLEGGKRIRPIILNLAAESVGKIDENVLAASCAVEFLHMESIIHDDIIDNETMRRQKEPFHIKYGYNTSVLTGDFVLGLILAISSRLDNARITKDLATTAMLMSEGEMIEGRLETSEDVTFDDYLKLAKDGAIFLKDVGYTVKSEDFAVIDSLTFAAYTNTSDDIQVNILIYAWDDDDSFDSRTFLRERIPYLAKPLESALETDYKTYAVNIPVNDINKIKTLKLSVADFLPLGARTFGSLEYRFNISE